MKRFAIVASVIFGSIGVAYAAAPELVEACCECCKEMIDCCCGH